MSPLRLQTFGTLALHTADGDPVAFPHKALLLVCLLRLGDRIQVRRDEASAALWPDADRDIQQMNLRKLVSRIRQAQADLRLTILSITETSISVGEDGERLDMDASCFHQPETSLETMIRHLRERFLGGRVPAGGLQRFASQQVDTFYFRLRERLLLDGARPVRREDPIVLREAAFLLLERNIHDEQVRGLLERHAVPAMTMPNATPGPQAPARVPSNEPPPQRPATAAGGTPGSWHPVPPQVPSQTQPVLAVTASLPRLALLPPVVRFGASRTLGSTVAALVDDIAIGLCALRNVSIVAPYTAKRIQESDDTLAMLETHAVSYLVETTVSAEGLLVRIIFVPLDSIIWAERFSLDVPYSLHRTAIAKIIADNITSQLQRTQDPLVEYELHPDAYRAYLAGARQTRHLSLPSVRGARRGFREALTYRRDFAPSFIGLARSFSLEWVLTARGDRSLLQKAEEHARIAIAQDPMSAAGFKELGVAKLYLGDLEESLEALARAEALSPHYADAIYSYADSLVHASRPDEGLLKIKRAIDLNPLCPDDYLWSAAGASYFVGNYQDAVDYINRMAQQSNADRLRAASFAMLGDITMARRYRRKDREANPHFDLDRWLAVLPIRESWQKELYREGLSRAGY